MIRRDEMVRSRGESSATGDASLLPASVPEIGRSLRLAREQAELTLPEAAEHFGLRITALDALESGGIGPQHDRIETLRNLRTYANALGLPGDAYVLVAVEQWPAATPTPATNGDTAVVPIVSISSAPAGGHSPAGMGIWTSEATGVADATTTGVFDAVTRPVLLSESSSLSDTSQVPIVDTGEVQAVNFRTPRVLKVLVGIVAFLIVLAGAALLEHDNVNQWAHDVRSTTAHWYDNAKVAVGITSTQKGHPSATTPTSTPTSSASKSPSKSPTKPAAKASLVKVVPDPSGLAATFNVKAGSFTVKILAENGPSWVQATEAGNPKAVFAQTLAAGQSHIFAVTSPLTIETGSGAGRAYIYKGFTLIKSYVPAKAPFTMTFNPAP